MRKLSSGEAFGNLLGFQPVSATRSYDAYVASKCSDDVRSEAGNAAQKEGTYDAEGPAGGRSVPERAGVGREGMFVV